MKRSVVPAGALTTAVTDFFGFSASESPSSSRPAGPLLRTRWTMGLLSSLGFLRCLDAIWHGLQRSRSDAFLGRSATVEIVIVCGSSSLVVCLKVTVEPDATVTCPGAKCTASLMNRLTLKETPPRVLTTGGVLSTRAAPAGAAPPGGEEA